jgi:hypothetical protein
VLYSKTTNQIEPSTIFSTNFSTTLRTYRTLPLESTACTSPEPPDFDSPSAEPFGLWLHPWGLSSKTMQNLILEISVTYLIQNIQNIQGISRKCMDMCTETVESVPALHGMLPAISVCIQHLGANVFLLCHADVGSVSHLRCTRVNYYGLPTIVNSCQAHVVSLGM